MGSGNTILSKTTVLEVKPLPELTVRGLIMEDHGDPQKCPHGHGVENDYRGKTFMKVEPAFLGIGPSSPHGQRKKLIEHANVFQLCQDSFFHGTTMLFLGFPKRAMERADLADRICTTCRIVFTSV